MGIENFITSKCSQTAVYWGIPVNDGFGGLTYEDPIEIPCRWEDVSDVLINRDGNVISAKTIVYVTQDVEKEGMLFLGTLNDLDSTEIVDPLSNENAFIIKRIDKLPALGSSTQFMRKTYLAIRNML